MNKQRGYLANRFGTVAEDIAAPNIPRIVKEYFGCSTILDFAVRRRVVNSKDNSGIFSVLSAGRYCKVSYKEKDICPWNER
ncbi:MAG: hypothetical protein J7K04_12510 [Spirochaetales bacterium]|nr:hypothetical protein [Spirochaetales bacterium]